MPLPEQKTFKQLVYSKLPIYVKEILIIHNGWLVGNAVNNIIEYSEPKDYDIIIPNREAFQMFCLAMNNDPIVKVSTNSYGGMKLKISDLSIDVWCEELSHFLSAANSVTYVYNMKKNLLLKSI